MPKDNRDWVPGYHRNVTLGRSKAQRIKRAKGMVQHLVKQGHRLNPARASKTYHAALKKYR